MKENHLLGESKSWHPPLFHECEADEACGQLMSYAKSDASPIWKTEA